MQRSCRSIFAGLLVASLVASTPCIAASDALHPVAAPSAVLGPAEEARRRSDLAQAAYYEKKAKEQEEDAAPKWLNLVLGTGLTLVASILTLAVTSFSAAWKSRKEQGRLYSRHKLQVGLAVRALVESLIRLRLDGTTPVADFLSRRLLLTQPTQPRAFDRGADYYLKYDLVSTVYRLCALLGWMELYRIDPDFLAAPSRPPRLLALLRWHRAADPGNADGIEEAFSRIRSYLGDDVASFRTRCPEALIRRLGEGDGVVLADDQRAIGEKMLATPEGSSVRAVVGYAYFAETLFRFPGLAGPRKKWFQGGGRDLPQDHWIWNATSFIVGLGDGPDWRIARLRCLNEELRHLLSILLPEPLQNGLAAPPGSTPPR